MGRKRNLTEASGFDHLRADRPRPGSGPGNPIDPHKLTVLLKHGRPQVFFQGRANGGSRLEGRGAVGFLGRGSGRSPGANRFFVQFLTSR